MISTWLYFSLKLVHVLAMALWVGGPPAAVHGLRRELGRGPEAALALVQRLISVTPIFVGAALVTVVSGICLLLAAGGPSNVAPQVLVGAALVVPIFAIGGGAVRPALLKLKAHFASGGAASAVEPIIQRFVWAHRTEQALRLCALAMMVLRF